MTREEAIANLNMISVAFVEPVTKEQRELIDETFDMAIKALKQEVCEDCISRKAARDIIAEYFFEHKDSNRLREKLESLPSVKIEPKTDLDKIRAEIIENSIEDYKYHGCGTDELIIETSEVLKIIDKYRQKG